MTPILTTARLTLGPLTLAHVAAFQDFCATKASRFIGGPADALDAAQGALAQAGQWQLRGFGPFWLNLTETGAPVGRAGLTFPPHRDEPELTWVIYPAHQNRGLATEAALAARDWAAATHGLTGLISLIDDANAASVRVAEKLGASREAVHSNEGGRQILRWRHPKGPQ